MKKNIKTGIGLLCFGAMLIALHFVAGVFGSSAGVALALVFAPIIDMEGVEAGSDEEKFLKGLQKRMKKQEVDGITKAEYADLIAKEMAKFKELDTEKLAELLNVEKGVMSVLKKMGAEITALKENGGKAQERTLKTMLSEKLKDVEKLFKTKGENGPGEVAITLKAAAVITTANGVDDTTAGLPASLIESFSEAAFVPKRYPREYVYDLANVITVADMEKYTTWLEEGSEQGSFAIVSEGGLKPLVSTSLVRNFATAKKVAGKYVVTEEFTKFYANAYNIIQRLISQKMLRDKAALLTTDLLALASAYTGSALDGHYPDVTDYHAIGAVAAQIEALNFEPDTLILNPQDKWRIGLEQDNEGRFYLPNLPTTSPVSGTTMMGFTLRTSNRVPVGHFLLGESGLWNIEQEAITIRMGYGVTVTGSNPVTAVVSDFDNNQFRLIVETWIKDWIGTNNVGSFVYASFATVKAALEGVS